MRSGGQRKPLTCSRRAAAAGPQLLHDPALALLGALAADVDTPGTRAERAAAWPGGPAQPAWPGRAAAEPAVAWQSLAAAQPRGAAVWLRTAAAGGVVAGLASVTSLIATSMLARLARGPARGGGWQRRPARPRRLR